VWVLTDFFHDRGLHLQEQDSIGCGIFLPLTFLCQKGREVSYGFAINVKDKGGVL